jgi:hypothetical protein
MPAKGQKGFARSAFTRLKSSAVGEPGRPDWTAEELQEMSDSFRLAMTAAIENGSEHCVTGVSTRAGTRNPIIVL